MSEMPSHIFRHGSSPKILSSIYQNENLMPDLIVKGYQVIMYYFHLRIVLHLSKA